MSALAFPSVPLTVPARGRHLVAVPDLPAGPAVPTRPRGRGEPVRTEHARQPVVRRASASAPAAAPLRLTDRGRAVLVVLAFLLAAALGTGVGLALPTAEPMPEQVQSVTVGPGESLWTIAESVAAEGQDVRVVIDQIMTLNGLSAATVHAGQELTVPAGG